MDASSVQIRAQVAQEPVPLGIGKRERLGRDPLLALGLAILVGLAVFAVLWRIRKVFGMKG
jgi:hypothetical protein